MLLGSLMSRLLWWKLSGMAHTKLMYINQAKTSLANAEKDVLLPLLPMSLRVPAPVCTSSWRCEGLWEDMCHIRVFPRVEGVEELHPADI